MSFFCQGDDDSEDENSPSTSKPKTRFWEDIYGRTRDADGNVVKSTTTSTSSSTTATATKYVPPALRAQAAGAAGDKAAADAALLAKLSKQVR
jgi:nucleolar MIF4G domain-containing protein 1